jgi:hypothetical protein
MLTIGDMALVKNAVAVVKLVTNIDKAACRRV